MNFTVSVSVPSSRYVGDQLVDGTTTHTYASENKADAIAWLSRVPTAVRDWGVVIDPFVELVPCPACRARQKQPCRVYKSSDYAWETSRYGQPTRNGPHEPRVRSATSRWRHTTTWEADSHRRERP